MAADRSAAGAARQTSASVGGEPLPAGVLRHGGLGGPRHIHRLRRRFDGNPTKLFPLSEKDRAARIIELAGGRDQVLLRARRAVVNKDFQWAAELTDYVLAM